MKLAHRKTTVGILLFVSFFFILFSLTQTTTANAQTTVLEGVALKDRTHVYESTSKNSASLKSYAQGSILLYRPYSNNWYEATVIINGKPQTGYIHRNDVETATSTPESLKGIALKNKTKVYSRASKKASSPRSYSQGSILQYKTFTSEWYSAIIIKNGQTQNVYIHVDDVENSVTNQVTLKGISKNKTNVYTRASKSSKSLKSYGAGRTLIYKTFSSEWYEAIVIINGKPQTGYIHKNDVDTKLSEQTDLKGIGIKDRTNVYSGLSKDSKVLKSYPEGSVLYYRTLSENWHEAVVFINGKRHTGYIHKDDVENAYNSQESLRGTAAKSKTNVYSRASKKSKVLRSYNKDRVLLFKTFSPNWYEAIVIINGKQQTGYIHKKDVNTSKFIEEITEYDRHFDELVDIWMTKNPQIWTPSGWKDATRSDVEYYANPNNFTDRNASSFYQYLVLSQPAGLNPREVNDKILFDKGSLIGMGNAFVQAGKTHSVNEVYLLAHALHETRNGTSALAQGVKINGKTVYNFYGIGAIDRCPVECGAEYAYNQGWFTPEDAIIGGARFIARDYIHVGQDTLYKMRWNPDFPGHHQYATDVNWALAQTSRIASLYSLIDDYVLFFDIPAYVGAPTERIGKVINITTTLNIRSTPEVKSGNIIGSLRNGEQVRFVTDNKGNPIKNGNWYNIKIPGSSKTGWVSGDYIEIVR